MIPPGASLRATLTTAEAAAQRWGAIIIGAGPAGSAAAIGLAQRGCRVLLVDKSPFPRGKVCGCCLNATSLAALAALGLGDPRTRHGAQPLHELRLAAAGRAAAIPLPEGAALSRETLDAALVSRAIAAGAHFLPQTLAALGEPHPDHRVVQLRSGDDQTALAGGILLVADGLAGHVLDREPGFGPRVDPRALIGAGATLTAPAPFYRAGIIYMACARDGYVGLTRLEDGRLDIAAALDAARTRDAGGPASLIASILAHAGFPQPADLGTLRWHGTPQLTRRRARAGHRLLVLGDAAGYVEPFTGEGIGWALTAGRAAATLLTAQPQLWSPDLPRRWAAEYRRLLGAKQWTCRLLARALRSPILMDVAVATLACVPQLARPLVRRIGTQPRLVPVARAQAHG